MKMMQRLRLAKLHIFTVLFVFWPVLAMAETSDDSELATDELNNLSLQQLIELADQKLYRPDGLYRGTLTLLRRDQPTVVQQIDLIIKSPKSYVTIQSARRGEQWRLLWMGDGTAVWLFDVQRRFLLRPEASQRFDPVSAMGFSPVDFFYPWFAANLKPQSIRSDPLESDWRILQCKLIDTESPRLAIGIDRANRPIRLEVQNESGILLRVLEFRYDRPIIEWKTGRQYVPEYPTVYEMMDIRRGSIARFETRIYDPKFRPDPSLFDPDFLSR